MRIFPPIWEDVPDQPTYDGRGNLQSAGGLSFGYTALNQLQNASSGAWFYHDAAGRLDVDAGTSSCASLDNLANLLKYYKILISLDSIALSEVYHYTNQPSRP